MHFAVLNSLQLALSNTYKWYDHQGKRKTRVFYKMSSYLNIKGGGTARTPQFPIGHFWMYQMIQTKTKQKFWIYGQRNWKLERIYQVVFCLADSSLNLNIPDSRRCLSIVSPAISTRFRAFIRVNNWSGNAINLLFCNKKHICE